VHACKVAVHVPRHVARVALNVEHLAKRHVAIAVEDFPPVDFIERPVPKSLGRESLDLDGNRRISSVGELERHGLYCTFSCGVTYRAAQKQVTRLVEHGILREATGRERYRVSLADKILAILQERESR
jgi:hypothetical protein